MNPLWTVAPAAVLSGAAMLWIFRRTADVPAIRTTADRIQAHLLEFWLYVDDPGAIWKSWKGLLAANARLGRLLLLPLLILSVLTLPLFFLGDAVYGSWPLRVGKPALVTLSFTDGAAMPALQAPDGIALETPPVRVPSERQISWRIRPLRPLSGELQWTVAGASVGKSVTAGDGWRFHSPLRTRSTLQWIRYPAETLLPASPIQWIEIAYPPATFSFLGHEAHWSVWFVAFSLLGAGLTVLLP